MRGHLVGHAPPRGGPDWHAVRIVLGTALVLILVGVALGAGLGYGLSRLLNAVIDSVGS